jgi:hypothetical protein
MVLRPRWYAGSDTDERDDHHRQEKGPFHVRMPTIEHFTSSFLQVWTGNIDWLAHLPCIL